MTTHNIGFNEEMARNDISIMIIKYHQISTLSVLLECVLANNKGNAHTALMQRLTSAFVVRLQ